MRPLVVKMSMSFDGYVTSPDGSHEWIFPTYSDDAGDWTIGSLEQAAAHLMGATTYHAMASTWPGSDSRYAPYMNDRPKVVFSDTLSQADWQDTRILSSDLDREVAALKAEPGGDGVLLAHGGPTFVRSLVATGLVDEYRMLVHPVVVGEGRSIFSAYADLDVVHVEPFSGGAVAYTLRPKQEVST